MTAAKPHHKAARALLLRHLDLHPGRTVSDDLDPLEAGIVGDTAHAAGGDSYHLGEDKIRARAGRSRYSVDESARDGRGLDGYASGMDIGYFKVRTSKGTFDLYDFNAWLIGLCRAGDPDTRDLREVIYSPDGDTLRRWDDHGRRPSGDNSHRTHTHLSEYRDADGHRMVALATRWLQHIGLLPEEDDDVAFADEKIKVTKTTGTELFDPDLKEGAEVTAASVLQLSAIHARRAALAAVAANTKTDQIIALLSKLAGHDFTDEDAIVAGVLAGLDPAVIAAAIPADLAQQVADELATRLQE
jgi:hypothetical protein